MYYDGHADIKILYGGFNDNNDYIKNAKIEIN